MRVLVASFFVLASAPAHTEQPFPSRQITIVVPFAAGGPSDTMARLVAQGIGEKVGGRVIEYALDPAGYRVRRLDEPVDPEQLIEVVELQLSGELP